MTQQIVHPENIITIPAKVLNHLGQPFKPAIKSKSLIKYCRSFARRMWRESFGAKVVWRSSRQPGADCSFRIYSGRCAA